MAVVPPLAGGPGEIGGEAGEYRHQGRPRSLLSVCDDVNCPGISCPPYHSELKLLEP